MDNVISLFKRRSKFTWELEEVIETETFGNITCLELRFSSYSCQAANAGEILRLARAGQRVGPVPWTEDERRDWEQMDWYFGQDPCAL
ncbi:hypothetical protein F4778DRAFT_779461 [Xylariomycetidae sp. FL2044]|nr:hypothetical protein F4778DRAFT_779461 [Xylariomycetidae sp. FL2044]